MKNKILSLILISVFTITLFTGCGKKAEEIEPDVITSTLTDQGEEVKNNKEFFDSLTKEYLLNMTPEEKKAFILEYIPDYRNTFAVPYDYEVTDDDFVEFVRILCVSLFGDAELEEPKDIGEDSHIVEDIIEQHIEVDEGPNMSEDDIALYNQIEDILTTKNDDIKAMSSDEFAVFFTRTLNETGNLSLTVDEVKDSYGAVLSIMKMLYEDHYEEMMLGTFDVTEEIMQEYVDRFEDEE